MLRTVVNGKIHRATVTQADLHYVGSITIDRHLMDRADFVEGEKVLIVDVTNGARLERINFLADTSPKGLEESASMMVNYLYKWSDIEKNHEAYSEDGTVRKSSQVSNLLNN